MSCINQMMQHQQIRGCQWVFSDKEHRGKMFRRSDLSSKPSLQTNPPSKLQAVTFSPESHQKRNTEGNAPGRRCLTSAWEQRKLPARAPWQPKQNWQGVLAGRACAPAVSTAFTALPARPLRYPRAPGYTWQHKQPYPWTLWHTLLPNKPEKRKGRRYHGIQMRAFKPEMQPEIVRTAT